MDREAAMDAGADDHMAKPADVDVLLEHIDALLQHNIAKAQLKDTIIIPVFSLKGGVGTTTVAVNLASILRQVAPTVLLDLSHNCGTVRIFPAAATRKSTGDNILKMPETPMDSLVLKHPSNLQVLLAPPIPGQYEWPNEDQVEAILGQP